MEILSGKRHRSYLAAKAAGFLFTDDGKANSADPWVQAMIARRDGTVRSAMG